MAAKNVRWDVLEKFTSSHLNLTSNDKEHRYRRWVFIPSKGDEMIKKIGFIGVGHIAHYMLTGFSQKTNPYKPCSPF